MNAPERPPLALRLHASLAEPLTIGGVPRAAAIVNASVGAAVAFGLQAPWIGGPLFLCLHLGEAWICASDPHGLAVLRRHLLQRPHLEG